MEIGGVRGEVEVDGDGEDEKLGRRRHNPEAALALILG